jgi:hypothetical protein
MARTGAGAIPTIRREVKAMAKRIPALIRMLGSPNDNEALGAARALVRELSNNGEHLDDLAQAWERAQAQRPPAQKSKPLDYTKVETAVTLYAQDKNKVTMNNVILAVKEMVAELHEPYDTLMTARYITARLRALGFKPSRSGSSYSR